MTSKLTLSVEQDIIEKAKRYAKRNNRSLSDVVESYLRSLVYHTDSDDALKPDVKKLLGSVKVTDQFDYKSALQDALAKRHQK